MSSRRFSFASTMKRVAIALVVFLVGAEVVLRFLPVQSGQRSLPVNDSSPVARFAPNRDFVFSSGWAMSMANRSHINNVGFVNAQDYDSTLTTPLLAVIGNDNVEAAMVPFDSTIHGRLGHQLGGEARVYSFGGAGAALSQYLSWVDYARQTFHPRRLAVVVSPGDADHSLLKYWRDQGFLHFVDGPNGSLVLKRVDYEPSRVRQIVRLSALARYVIMNGHLVLSDHVESVDGTMPSDPDSVRIRDNERAVDAFLSMLPEHAAMPPQQIAIVVDGVRPALYGDPVTPRAAYERHMQRYVVEHARQAGFEVIDMEPIFTAQYARDSIRYDYETDYRWNHVAHRLVAEALAASPVVKGLMGAAEDSGAVMPCASVSCKPAPRQIMQASRPE